MPICKSCEREVIWAELSSGRNIMLDDERRRGSPGQPGSLLLAGGLRLWVVVNGKAHLATAEDDRLHREVRTCHWDTSPSCRSRT